MSNGIIAIIDSEAEYALKLAEYFNHKSGLNYSVMVFTDYESLLNFLNENYIDILLVSEQFCSHSEEFDNVRNVFVLTEGNVDSVINQYASLYKYQPSDSILREVMCCYAATPDAQKRLFSTSGPSKILGIYSPVKRCGKTTFALALGCISSLSNRCLYINLEEYSGFSYYISDDSVGDLSDLLYFYRQTPSSIEKKLLTMCNSFYNLSILPPMKFSYDIKNVETQDLVGLINCIADTGLFDEIILDISDSVRDVPGILELCHKVFMPSINDSISRQKIKDFFTNISAVCDSDIESKTQVIQVPADGSLLFSNPTINYSCSEFTDKLLATELGIYVKNFINI